ncbi:MAG: hypothetical protein ABMA25_14745 [Ilumatobacteraceae bacterium]
MPTSSAPDTTLVDQVALPDAIPPHGIAYRTAAGTVIATVTGEALFTIEGVHVIDRSRDLATMAAVVAFDSDASATPEAYALQIGASTMEPADTSTEAPGYAIGWVAEGAPSGCLRDARHAGSDLLLCSTDAASGPDRLGRSGESGASELIPMAPVQPVGHWVSAIPGPDGYIAATWSGECEHLTAYLISPENQATPIAGEGGSMVLEWVDGGVLVARFDGCGGEPTPPQLVLVASDGQETLIPTPGAIEAAIAW